MSAEEWEAKCLQLELELEELQDSSRQYEEELQQEIESLARKEKQLQHELDKSREMFNQAREELNQSHKEETRKMFQLAQEKQCSEERGNQLMSALRAMEMKTELFENRDRVSREELLICQSRLEESVEENEFLKVEIEDLETFISNLQKQAVVLKEELTALQALQSNKRASMNGTLEFRAVFERVGQLEKEKQELINTIDTLRAADAVRSQLQEERLQAEMAKHSNEERSAQLQFELQEKKILCEEIEQLRQQLAAATKNNIPTPTAITGNVILQENITRRQSLHRGDAEGDSSAEVQQESDIPIVTITASDHDFEQKQQVASTRVDQIEQQLLHRAEAAKIRRTLDRQKSTLLTDPPPDVPFDVRFAQEKQQRAERRANFENYQQDKQLVLKNEPRHLPPPRPFTLVRDLLTTRLREPRADSRSPGDSNVTRSPRSNPGSPDSVAKSEARSPRRRLSQDDYTRDHKEPKISHEQVDLISTPGGVIQPTTTSTSSSAAIARLYELAAVPTRPTRVPSVDGEPVVLHRVRTAQTLNLPSRAPPATPPIKQADTKRSRTASSIIPPARHPPSKPTQS